MTKEESVWVCWGAGTRGRDREHSKTGEIGERKPECGTLVNWEGGHAVQREPRRNRWKITSPVLGPNSLTC